MWEMGDGWGWHMGDDWWMGFGWLWFIVLIIIVVWVVRALIRSSRTDGAAGPLTRREPHSLEILNRRYASGEMTEEEYDRLRRRLLGKSDSNPRDSESDMST